MLSFVMLQAAAGQNAGLMNILMISSREKSLIIR